MQVKVYNSEGVEMETTMELPMGVFGLPWNGDLVHQVVTSQLANMRPQVAHVKHRAEVRGGGKKPWRQKGTGRARHGSIRSPIWRKGGVTHGPTKERNTDKKINKKAAKRALFTVLSAKAKDHEVVVVDGLNFADAKTKQAAIFMKNIAGNDMMARMKKGNGVLVALSETSASTRRALRNIPFVGIDEARNLTAWEALQYKFIMFPKAAIENLAKEAS